MRKAHAVPSLQPNPASGREVERGSGSAMFSSDAWTEIARSLKLSGRQLQTVQGTFDDKTEFAMASDLYMGGNGRCGSPQTRTRSRTRPARTAWSDSVAGCGTSAERSAARLPPRDRSVPEGTAFFLSVINSVNVDTPNVCGQGPEHIPVADRRAGVAPFIDGATKLSLTADGAGVNNLHRIKSGVFAVTLPDDNLFDTVCGGPGTVPAGVYSPAIDDGYYVEVNALSVGSTSCGFMRKAVGS